MAKPRTEPVPETAADLYPDLLDPDDDLAVFQREIVPLISDDDFADCYGDRGPIPVSPKLLCLVTLLQFLERLPDRQTARNVRFRLDWKIALGLPADYPAFHFCLLSEFRARLLKSDKAAVAFDKILQRLQELGLVRKNGKQRLDSTNVFGCLHSLSHLELVTETLRLAIQALEAILGAEETARWAPAGLLPFVETRFDPRELTTEKKRRRKVREAGRHAVALLARVDADPREHLRALPAIQLLRTVVAQNFKVVERGVGVPPTMMGGQDARGSVGADVPPAERGGVEPLSKEERREVPGPERIATPHDPEARYTEKHGKSCIGYKVELAETAEDEGPNFITHVEVQNAAEPDRAALLPVVEALEAKDLGPRELYVDQGYTSGEAIDTMRQEHGVDLRGPVAEEPDRGVFPLSRFEMDREERFAVCPAGKRSAGWSESSDGTIQIPFAWADCKACALRGRCTKGAGARKLRVRAHHGTVEARRAEQKTEAFQKEMHRRNAVEGTISELKRGRGLARSRYRGRAKLYLQALMSAAATNVRRLARALRSGCAVRARSRA